MKAKVYHLSTCNTCKRIIAELPLDKLDLQDIKTDKITAEQLDEMRQLAGSYEALFSRRSRQFRPRGLQEKNLTEADYRDLMLEEYTFLKRPVIVYGDKIFIGNAKKEVEGAREALDD